MSQPEITNRCPVVFHGTLSDSIPGILKEGIIFTEAEPGFTTDLSLAYNKYAHKGYNMPRFYSGETLREAKKLVNSGIIPAQDSEQQLLKTARSYWDKNDHSGAVFIISTAKWYLGPGPTAILQFDPPRKEVRGGLTKWLYRHTALYKDLEDLSEVSMNRYRKIIQREGGPTCVGKRLAAARQCRPHPTSDYKKKQKFFGRQEKNNSTARRRLTIPLSDIIMWFPVRPRVRRMLNRYNRQSIGLGNHKQLERKIKETLLKDIISLQEENEEFKKEFLLDLILEETRYSAVISALRRCFLSILRAKGYKMIKSDYMVPYEEDAHVFWQEGEIDSHIDALTGIIQKDKMLNRYFGKLTTLLKELWQANKLLDNPVVVYNEFKNDG